MRKWLRFFCLLPAMLLIIACAEQQPLPTATPAPTPLPTAVPPSGDVSQLQQDDLGNWAIGFSHDFPGGFWAPGRHRYGFRIECSQLDYDLGSDWQEFFVTDDVPAQPVTLYLRLGGLSGNEFAPVYLPEALLNPEQETTAVVYLVGLSEEAAKRARDSCDVLLGWDQRGAQVLEALEPFQP